LFSNKAIKLVNPSLLDLPLTIVELFGIPRSKEMIGKNIFTGA
jgi:hypothetical protein